MASSPPEYYGADTRVFWDVEDFPVPEDRVLCSFRENVGRALSIEGYVGDLSIYAFGGSKTPDERHHFARAKIKLVQEADKKRARLHRLLLELLAWAYPNTRTDRANYIVVAKDIPKENTKFVSVVQYLKKKGYNVFLAVPDDIPLGQLQEQGLPRTASVVWRWTDLFDGNLPIEELDSDSDCGEGSSEPTENRQKIADAASPN